MMTVMTNSDSQRNSLYVNQGFSFSLNKRVVQQVFILVLAIHLIIFLIAVFGLPSFKVVKRPDITIELGAAPEASDGPMNSMKPKAQAMPKEVSKEVSKDKTPPLKKDKDASAIPVPAQAKQSSAQPAALSSSGVAAAPTADADYKSAYLQNPKPPYPPLAFKARMEGKVILLAEVLGDGRAGQVRILTSSGHELLDQSALSTVKNWKFTPARKDGVIITQAVRIPIIFSLKNR
jgi:periplasmic protein TonB